VDVGINSLVTCSEGTVFANPKAYRKAKKKLKRLQRSVSRKQNGSKNRAKAVKKLGRLHLKVANIRLDTLHKVTGWLAKNHSEIIIEDLNVSGLLKNHRLASAIADCGFYEFRRQLTYKCDWYGSKLVIADRFYPSSQICSHCNHRQKMPLKERVFTCSNCGYSLDRDRNASINLERWHLDIEYPKTVSYTGLACGESKPFNSSSVEDSLKQEVDIKPIFEQLRLFD
jgi:putative transposase